VVAVDLLEIRPVAGVHRIRGDVMDEPTVRAIEDILRGRKADLVLSDMAPNITGNWSVDHPRSMELAERVLTVARRVLRPGGSLLVKVFQGEGFKALRRAVEAHFGTVRIRKPPASRSESREMYLVAGNYHL
jgi:23S rRNA (uridine2552-2'-O)-methyltransferase